MSFILGVTKVMAITNQVPKQVTSQDALVDLEIVVSPLPLKTMLFAA